MKKLLIGFLVILTIIVCFTMPVKADEGDGEGDPDIYSPTAMRDYIKSMYDEGSSTINITFDLNTTAQSGNWDFEYNDNWFRNSAEEYNHKLARLTFGMAISSFRPNYDSIENPSAHIVDFLDQGGFSDLRMDDYDKNPSLYTVSTVMAHKHLDDDKGGFELLAIGICGGGYQNEWLSNFSIGDEVVHVGFNSAANEVFDRIFGYMAQNQLTNKRVKLWFGGFSRAAAISNVLAAKLVDSKQFSTSDIFTYTFATPRTTKDPKPGMYPNIYNIVGKMDPVPSVPFADWGYERYGRTFYLPAQQTDSDYVYKLETTGQVYYELVNTYWWNNIEMDTSLRILLNYMLKIAPTSHAYKEHLQDHLIDIWSDKSLTNVMNELMQIAGNEELINDNNKTEANSLLTYLAYSAFGLATGSNVESIYMNYDATMLGNLAHEHTPEVYLSWLFSQEKSSYLYSDNMDYLRIVISGKIDVAVFDMDEDNGLIKAIDEDGNIVVEFAYDGKEYESQFNASSIFMFRDNGETICLIPKDANYKVVIVSTANQTVSLHGLRLKVGYTNGNFSKLYKLNMKKGQYDVIYSPRNQDLNGDGYYGIVNGDTFDVSTMVNDRGTSFAVELERNNVLNLSWRQIVILIFTIPTLIISLAALLITWQIGKTRLKRKIGAGQIRSNVVFDKVPSACIIACVAIFVLQEVVYWLMPKYLLQRGMLKLMISILAIFLCYRGYKAQPNSLSRSILITLIVCCLGDVVINYNFLGGIVCFGIATMILSYFFYKFEKPDRWQYIAFAIGSVLVVCIIIYNRQKITGWTVAMCLYAVALTALQVLSLTKPRKIRVGSILLTISNVLIFFNTVNGATLYSHVLSLGIYYAAVLCFARSTKYKNVRDYSDVSIVEPTPAS